MKQLIIALALCAAASSAFAQGAPATVSFTARLQDAGLPLMGSHDFGFALYDQPTAGANLWQETRPGVAVEADGMLYLDLGTVTALTASVFAGNARYLEITIDGVVSTPRVLIESVPYSLHAGKASDTDTLAGHTLAFFQQTIANTCSGTQAIQTINADGSVSCYTGQVYTAGSGLAAATNVFSVDYTQAQKRVTGTCATGAVNAIAADGTVTCVAVPSYTAGTGISITTNQISVDFATVQHAIGACAAGSTINKVDSAGNPTCVNSTYTAGTGLALASNQFRVDTTVIEPHIATAAARVDTPETRNNAGYGDLATTGPSATVTIPASGAALVTVTGQVAPPMGGTGYMSFAGANIGAADNQALIRDAGTSNSTGYLQASATFYVTGITPGSQTFTAKYRSSAGDTVTFSNRHLIVVPLP